MRTGDDTAPPGGGEAGAPPEWDEQASHRAWRDLAADACARAARLDAEAHAGDRTRVVRTRRGPAVGRARVVAVPPGLTDEGMPPTDEGVRTAVSRMAGSARLASAVNGLFLQQIAELLTAHAARVTAERAGDEEHPGDGERAGDGEHPGDRETGRHAPRRARTPGARAPRARIPRAPVDVEAFDRTVVDVGLELRLHPRTARTLVHRAKKLAARLPLTGEAMRSGLIGPDHAEPAIDHVGDLTDPDTHASDYDRHMADAAVDAWRPALVDDEARRTLATLEPDQTAARELAADSRRRIRFTPRPDATGRITIDLSAEAMAVVRRMIRAAVAVAGRAPGETRTAQQLSVDLVVRWATRALTVGHALPGHCPGCACPSDGGRHGGTCTDSFTGASCRGSAAAGRSDVGRSPSRTHPCSEPGVPPPDTSGPHTDAARGEAFGVAPRTWPGTGRGAPHPVAPDPRTGSDPGPAGDATPDARYDGPSHAPRDDRSQAPPGRSSEGPPGVPSTTAPDGSSGPPPDIPPDPPPGTASETPPGAPSDSPPGKASDSPPGSTAPPEEADRHDTDTGTGTGTDDTPPGGRPAGHDCACDQEVLGRLPRNLTQRAILVLTAPATTVAGRSDTPGEISGAGPVTAHRLRGLLARLTTLGVAVVADVVATDATGRPVTPVQEPDASYEPATSTARAVRRRDRTCRIGGCTRPAEYADLDHTVPYDGDPAGTGPTHPANLAVLCRGHHLEKSREAWSLTHDVTDRSELRGTGFEATGELTVTTRSGRQYTARPEPLPHDPVGDVAGMRDEVDAANRAEASDETVAAPTPELLIPEMQTAEMQTPEMLDDTEGTGARDDDLHEDEG